MNIRPIRIFVPVLAAVAIMNACGERKPDSAEKPAAAAAPTDSLKATFDMAAGVWDWSRGDSTCLGNTHTISFTPDRQTMTLTFNAPADTTLKSRLTTYRVVSAGRGLYLDFPHVVRGAIIGESRRTTTGDLVVWDLVLASPNRYHWHRTDWPDDGATPAVVRCDGTTPMEKGVPPPPPPPQFGPTRGP